ncbi:alpha-L-fucosidase [uncultured Mucilaginibacter sp.]|uniref:alpha-L-fucosidase n=1 Tax=uncultured Mucilaginibacter sp. TaxID=797541 RepID=UPI0025F8442A|nr:alpha-L-fucosidase [uncultured Mucilaginibacter sp.]
MKNKLTALLFLLSGAAALAQPAPKPYGVLPSKRQLHWQETEMYCIVHFSMATFTDKEWGYGDEPNQTFNPAHFSAMQILGAAKAGGLNGIVVVAKHHDGFCLWPTKTTDHNVSKSLYKNGHGDILREYELATQKLGMKMGLYCSPWDRNNPIYGTPEYVTNIYRKQLKELYSNYGPLFMSWHDGANGGDGYYGGTREVRKIDKSTYYGWNDTWAITRKMQPGACLFGDVGPDVRWVGNEEGHAGETCWATFTPHAEEGDVPSNGNIKAWESVEGTRGGKYWIPAECDVPLRPGWFYHQSQDGKSKTPYQLVDLYYKSVGRGACLDLGLSPDKTGQLTSEDVNKLKQFGQIIKKTFAVNLAHGATFTADNVRGHNLAKYGPEKLMDNDRYSYWATDDAVTSPELTINLHSPKTFNVIRLRENIKLGQRIDSIGVDAWLAGKWTRIAGVTSIGACRLIRLPQTITSSKIRLHINAPVCIALSDFGLFKEPVHLTAPEIIRDKTGNVSIVTEAPVESIHYTLDGSEPTLRSALYAKPISLKYGGVLKAASFDSPSARSEIAIKQFGLSKQNWKVLSTNPSSGNAQSAIDEDPYTTWNTTEKEMPQEISISLGEERLIKAFTYLPRQDKKIDGIADRYTFSTSTDGVTWSPVAEGEFSNIKSNPIEQTVALKQAAKANYFKFTIKHVVSGNGVSVAEVGVIE